ncbi:hypothetical protein N8083_01390 [Candidatus Pacebacteria bacterium]|nr:hypothetical protein [Candidatus Paceibacterota bacterium]
MIFMPRRWSPQEEEAYRKELNKLYLDQNKTIAEIAKILCISEKTVFQRLKRLEVETQPHKKPRYQNKRIDIKLPKGRSAQLAELLGIMFGDGHISHFQVTVTLGNKETKYATYVQHLLKEIFGGKPKISIKKGGYKTVYLGSVDVVVYLRMHNLVSNKVKNQIDAPAWIFTKPTFMESFLRGFFDTDGSIYKIRYGKQINFCNLSIPLLRSLQQMLIRLEYSPSRISCNKIYITKKSDVYRFFKEVQPQNKKHLERYREFSQCVGTQAVNEDRL